MLELCVKVININPEKGHAILELKKGKSIEAIAEELEESQEVIAKIIEVLKNS